MADSGVCCARPEGGARGSNAAFGLASFGASEQPRGGRLWRDPRTRTACFLLVSLAPSSSRSRARGSGRRVRRRRPRSPARLSPLWCHFFSPNASDAFFVLLLFASAGANHEETDPRAGPGGARDEAPPGRDVHGVSSIVRRPLGSPLAHIPAGCGCTHRRLGSGWPFFSIRPPRPSVRPLTIREVERKKRLDVEKFPLPSGLTPLAPSRHPPQSPGRGRPP